MAIIYVRLIVKGKMTFADVPYTVKDQVRQLLIDMGLEHLIIE